LETFSRKSEKAHAVRSYFQEVVVKSAYTHPIRILLLVILVSLSGFGIAAHGQGTNGTLSGQITDPSAAAIPGATITLINVDTNYPQTAQTDSTGVYGFKLVPPGNYTLTVTMAAFEQYSQKGIVIGANTNVTQNVQLKMGTGKGETVTVTAAAELINTTTPELGMTINQQSVADLPLNGRDPSSLALLAPGMVDAGKAGVSWAQSGFSFPGESAASANGGRIGSTFYMLDGVSNMDNYLGSNSPTPNPDATQQFRLISNNFSAIYGFSTGGVVSMATRSGVNQWHGGLFEFLRNGDLDAGNWSNHTQDTYRRNQFGGYVGGPVLKDKLFFFFNYQGTVVVGGPGTSNNSTTTPTQQMLNGDFSGLIDYAVAHNSSCGTGYSGPQTLACGYLNGPFQMVNGKPNQLIGSLDPVAVQITNDGLPGHAAPASGTANPTSGAQNLAGQMLYGSANLGNTTYNEYTSRIDYDLSQKQRVTVRSFIDKFIQPAGDTPGNVLSVLNLNTWNQTFGEKMWYFNELAQHTWTVSPTTVNTASIFWTQQSAHNGTPVADKDGKNMCWSRYIGVTEPVCYMEGATFGGANGGWTEPSQEVRSTEGISDTMIKSIHSHTLSVGIDLQHQRAVEDAKNYPADAIIGFGGGYTGNGEADWLLGYMSSFEQGAGELADIQGWQVNPYVNDEWRVWPGLTLTLGLRWDPDLAPVSVGGRGSAFVAGQQSSIFPNAPTGLVFPGDKGVDAALRSSSKKFFEPRIGFAWQPSRYPRTSVHGAFGLFSAPVPYSDYNHVVDIAPFAPALAPAAPSNVPICATGGTTAACTPNTGQTVSGYDNFHNPWATSTFGTNGVSPFPPFATVNYKPPTNSAIPGPVYEQDSFGRSFKAGMTQAWNLAIEQQVSGVMALRIAYVGSESYHQSYVQDDNYAAYSYCTSYTSSSCPAPGMAAKPVAPYSNFSGILEYDSGATANYHSLQVTVQRNMAHGLQGQSSFTYQKTIDVASSANIAASQNGINDPKNLQWSRGVSSASIPFVWTTNFVYRTPELRGQSLLVREAIGGWEVSPILSWQSGAPFSIGSGSSQSAYGEPGYGSGCLQFCAGDRADRVAGVPLKVRQGGRASWEKQYFNPAAFTARHDGTFGNSARDVIFGPPSFNTDAALMKNWTLLERYQLQLRFEFFNAFNHVVMGNPDTTPTDSTFGQINGGAGSDAFTPREGQAALKFTF
jgi:hypothetical protein